MGRQPQQTDDGLDYSQTDLRSSGTRPRTFNVVDDDPALCTSGYRRSPTCSMHPAERVPARLARMVAGFAPVYYATRMADVALGRVLTTPTDGGVTAVTASLTVDFLSRAADGDWIQVAAHAPRAGQRMGFARAEFSLEDRLVAQATGIFAITNPRS